LILDGRKHRDDANSGESVPRLANVVDRCASLLEKEKGIIPPADWPHSDHGSAAAKAYGEPSLDIAKLVSQVSFVKSHLLAGQEVSEYLLPLVGESVGGVSPSGHAQHLGG
jgi:hypothetical protein